MNPAGAVASDEPCRLSPGVTWVFLCTVHQIVLVGIGGRRGSTRDVQLGEDVGDVPGDRLSRQEQLRRDSPVRLPGCHQLQYFDLACGQPTRLPLSSRKSSDIAQRLQIRLGAEPIE